MIENMKPCEKCDGKDLDLLATTYNHAETYQGICLSCGHTTDEGLTTNGAVDNWNRRTP